MTTRRSLLQPEQCVLLMVDQQAGLDGCRGGELRRWGCDPRHRKRAHLPGARCVVWIDGPQ
jgi:hypothetical protein